MAKRKNDQIDVPVGIEKAQVQRRRPWWQWVLIVFGGLWVVSVVGTALNIFPDAEERAATQTATAIIAGATSEQRTAVAAMTVAAMPSATAMPPTFTQTDVPPTNTPAPTATPVGYVTQAEHGDAWPFTVSDGIVSCETGNNVLFTSGGTVYAINGLAIGRNRWIDFSNTIWRDDPTGTFPKVNIHWVIEMGLDMCGGDAGGSRTAPTDISVAPVATVPAAAPVVARPGNCSTAVAMGMSAEQAAAAGLDRDGDNVACYGD